MMKSCKKRGAYWLRCGTITTASIAIVATLFCVIALPLLLTKPVHTSNPAQQGPDLIKLDSSTFSVIISLIEPQKAQISALLTFNKPMEYSYLIRERPKPSLRGPSRYIYNYHNADNSIYLFAGSKLIYKIFVTGTTTSSCPAQLFLFKNWQFYDNFKNGHLLNSFNKSLCLHPDQSNQTITFEITISASYYVGIYIASNTSVIGYISVEHVFYNTTEFDPKNYCSEQLSVNNPNCKLTICNVAPACSNQYYLLVNSTSNITYSIVEERLFSNNTGQIATLTVLLFSLLPLISLLLFFISCVIKKRYFTSGNLPPADTTEMQYDKLYKEFTEDVMAKVKEDKIGLAVIFGVVNKKGPQGADLDVENVKTTFYNINYATWIIKNPTCTIMRNAVKIVSEYNHYPIEFNWVVFYYTGHGGSIDKKGYFILSDDNDRNENFPIDSEVIDRFQPINPNCHLDNRKRLFLFDCCLKEDTTETLPISPPPLVDHNLPCYQPPYDFTIIAHATYYREVASGHFAYGGVWTSKLCNNIKQHAEDMTVNDILIKTRTEVVSETKFKAQTPFQIVNCADDCLLIQPREKITAEDEGHLCAEGGVVS